MRTRKISVEVNSDSEREAIEEGMKDPVVRATAAIVGFLKPYSKAKQTKMISIVQQGLELEKMP